MTGSYVRHGALEIAEVLHKFVENEALPGTGLSPGAFWDGLEKILVELAPRNKALLARRDDLQAKIDAWHVARKGKAFDAAEYKSFLDRLSRSNWARFHDCDEKCR